jgi:Bacterial alpha-L-rhamnosidase 6 hairpin glycosidase domain/Bacterial alpha-L-rhamnosidase C-terminal domain
MPTLRRRKRFHALRLGALACRTAVPILLLALSVPAAQSRGTVAAPAVGSFASSDPLLDRIWQVSITTANDMLAPGPLTTDAGGNDCAIELSVVLIDGAVRDRCPYVGDQWVVGAVFDVSTPNFQVQRAMLAWYAAHQRADGSVPASPRCGAATTLFDYDAYWLQTLHQYALDSGDLDFVRSVWPAVTRLIDTWYASRTRSDGLLVDDVGADDYALIPRHGNVVAYFNAQAALALRDAVQLATWLGDRAHATAWAGRADAIAAAFAPAFWDSSAGAFHDTTVDVEIHPQDANAYAVLAGVATRQQARAALRYLAVHNTRRWGNTIADYDGWDEPGWGSDASQRVYPFVSYAEVLARYEAGLDASALELLRREWGYMVTHGPQTTMWESIDASGEPVTFPPSWNHGWSAGAAPALTRVVLGVRSATPGYGEFVAEPHPSYLAWARGVVPTPNGAIAFGWTRTARRFVARVVSPVPGRLTLPVTGKATLDGVQVAAGRTRTSVHVGAGEHVLVVRAISPWRGPAAPPPPSRRVAAKPIARSGAGAVPPSCERGQLEDAAPASG